MTGKPGLSDEAMAVVDWLADVGPRWGLPELACRVHAVLYLIARPVAGAELAAELSLAADDVTAGLDWLERYGLAETTPQGWRTQTDPWTALMQTLEVRRREELVPARAVLEPFRNAPAGEDPRVVRQVQKLHELVADIAAIDAGARRISPANMRRMVGLGGRAARLVDRLSGGRRQS